MFFSFLTDIYGIEADSRVSGSREANSIRKWFAGLERSIKSDMATIGIDLGTTNSLAAVWRNGRVELIEDEFGNVIVPSIIAVDAEGAVLVGQAAREEELRHPERCASNFKRFMGTEKRYSLADRNWMPEELSALILRRLREMAEDYLGEPVTEAVISVPAYFNNDQRYATKLAAELAGISCERILNEPSAAALIGRQNRREEELLLVFDFGGGTLDVSIVDCFENIVEITAIAGDNHLGGVDFDEEIARVFCQESVGNGDGVQASEMRTGEPAFLWDSLDKQQKTALLWEARRCKEALSAQSAVEMSFSFQAVPASQRNEYRMELTTEKLFSIGQKLFRRMKQVITKAVMDAGIGLEDISGIVLVGGSSRMPVVQMFLSRLFEREITIGTEPDVLVAKGIGLYTGIKGRAEEVQDMLMTDVCPFSLGTEVTGDTPDSSGKMCMMVERNTTLPCRVTKQFTTAHDYQEQISFKIYQGEHYNPEQNLQIGELLLSVPPAPAGKEIVSVTLSYNINGILEVTAVSHSTGQTVNATIVSGYRHLSVEQVARKREQMEAMHFLSREEEEKKSILALGERLYAETNGALREYVARLIQQYHYVWSTGSPIRIRKDGAEVLKQLLAIDLGRKRAVFQYEEELFGLFEEEVEERSESREGET